MLQATRQFDMTPNGSHVPAAFCSCRTIFNGNGKLPAELELAVQHGVLVNVDSEFDFQNIAAAAKKVRHCMGVRSRACTALQQQQLHRRSMLGSSCLIGGSEAASVTAVAAVLSSVLATVQWRQHAVAASHDSLLLT
jgi:hypothetical protein